MDQPIRVAMIAACPFPWDRGTPARIYRMAEALSTQGVEVHVVTYHLGEAAPDCPFAIHRIRPVDFYRKTAPGPSLRKLSVLDTLLTRKLLQVVRKHDIQVLHAHHYEGLMVAAITRLFTRTPIVYDAHTLLSVELPSYGSRLAERTWQLVGRGVDGWLPRIADYTVTVTEDIRQALMEKAGIPESRIQVISNGVEYDFFAGRETLPSAARQVVFAGNFASYQGLDYLLPAFQQVLDRYPDTRLLLVSPDGLPKHYQALALKLGIAGQIEVTYTGFDQLPAQLARAAIAVNPRTQCPGIPQKLLNYLAAGKAIVSFRGSGKNLVQGETALLVEDGDITGFAQAMIRLLQEPALASQLGTRAQAAARNLSWAKVADRITSVYRSLMTSRAAEHQQANPKSS